MTRKVLITDDQPDLRQLLRWSLEVLDVEIEEATLGVEALQRAREIRPDLMVLDVMMPGEMDGLAVCREVKADPLLSNTWVILLSARGQLGDIQQGTQAGADAYIVKPFSPQRLLDTVEQLFSRASPDGAALKAIT